MRGNRRADTRPELRIRSLLHARGYRFRKDYRVRLATLSVAPDIVFTRQRVAVFIDGCFWHSCPQHGNSPRSNVEYWSPKLRRNVERDERVTASLKAAGWAVVRAWEHEPPEQVVADVANTLAARIEHV